MYCDLFTVITSDGQVKIMKPIQLHILSHDVVKHYFFINKQLEKLQHDICIALNCGTLEKSGCNAANAPVKSVKCGHLDSKI